MTLNANGSYTYDPNGAFDYLDDTENATDSFTYKASDGTALSNLAIVTITITGVNDAPVCQGATITTDENTVGSTLPNCTDPDGDTLTYTVTPATTGISGTNGSSILTFDPNGQFEGLDDTESDTDVFTYTANDGDEDSNAADVDVTVNGVNDPPICVAVTITTDENTAARPLLTAPMLTSSR